MKQKLLSKVMLLLFALVAGSASVWADTSTLTFTVACGGSGTADDGTSWTVTSDGSESAFDNSKGIHYGTGSAAVQYITLTTSAISGTISKVVVNASTASGASATVAVTVGGAAFGGAAQSLTTSAADYTFNGSASGEIVVTVTKPSSATKALYVKSVAVTYSTGPTTYSVTYNGNGNTSGSVPTDATAYSSGATVTVLGNTGSLAKAGYTFGASDDPEWDFATNMEASPQYGHSNNEAIVVCFDSDHAVKWTWESTHVGVSYFLDNLSIQR